MGDLLLALWNFIGSPQFAPLASLAQLTVIPLIFFLLKRVSAIYDNIAAIPQMKSDIRKLFAMGNQLKRDIARIEGATEQRHAQNIAAIKGAT